MLLPCSVTLLLHRVAAPCLLLVPCRAPVVAHLPMVVATPEATVYPSVLRWRGLAAGPSGSAAGTRVQCVACSTPHVAA